MADAKAVEAGVAAASDAATSSISAAPVNAPPAAYYPPTSMPQAPAAYSAPTYAAPAAATPAVTYAAPGYQVPAAGAPIPPPYGQPAMAGAPVAYTVMPPSTLGPADPHESAPPPVYSQYYHGDPSKSPTIFDPATNQPIGYQIDDQWVVVNTTQSLRMFCPYNNAWVTTHCERAPGGQAMMCCLFLWCFCWPLMLCPFLLPSCYDEVHRCNQCGNVLAVVPAGARQN